MAIIIVSLFTFIATLVIVNLTYPFFENIFKSWQKKRVDKISPRLDKIFIDIPQRKLLLIDIIVPLACGSAAFFITQAFSAALISAFAGLVIPNFILKQLEASRRRKFAGQLVDALMLLSGSLKAGLSLTQAFEALVEEMPAPISQEFALVVRQNRMGIPLEDCLERLKRRMQCEELDMIVTVILVARETGGDITAVFSNLVLTIRERSRLLGKVRALCAQGNLQGKIMMLLPILFGYSVYKMDPHFIETLINDPQGRILFGYAVISEIIGIFLISRMSKVEI